MSEFTPHFAPFAVLFFLGCVFLLGVSFLLLAYAAVRHSKPVAIAGAALSTMVVGGYVFLLCGASLFSSEKIVPRGGWKYFCEVDCHIAYSVAGVRTAAVLGPETQQTTARGQFVIIRLKTWFDEHTISPHRGNGPLLPGKRLVLLTDSAGHTFATSTAGEATLGHIEGVSAPLDQALRPGESFVTTLVFDVPSDARGLRLLVSDSTDDWLSPLIVGHESSFLHKKIYLGLDPAPVQSAHSIS